MELHILIDSSTKRTSKTDKYGESTAAWAAWWRDELKKEKPIRCGIHYLRREGPNKIFYEGIIRALEQCLDLCWDDNIFIWGDCMAVIDQLNGKRNIDWMRSKNNQVKALIKKYEQKNNTVSFEYLNEEKILYKKIDQLAKRSRKFILDILK